MTIGIKVALQRIGAELAKEVSKAGSTTLFVRAKDGDKWQETLVELLQGAAEKASSDKEPDELKWKLDASKYFFVDQGEVRYLWRLVLTGNAEEGVRYVASTAFRVATKGVKELDSYPLSEGSSTSSTQPTGN